MTPQLLCKRRHGRRETEAEEIAHKKLSEISRGENEQEGKKTVELLHNFRVFTDYAVRSIFSD